MVRDFVSILLQLTGCGKNVVPAGRVRAPCFRQPGIDAVSFMRYRSIPFPGRAETAWVAIVEVPLGKKRSSTCSMDFVDRIIWL